MPVANHWKDLIGDDNQLVFDYKNDQMDHKIINQKQLECVVIKALVKKKHDVGADSELGYVRADAVSQ